MDKKLDKILNVFKNGGEKKNYLLITLTVIVTIGLVVSLVATGLWDDIWYYPEKEYELLETEVQRMVLEKNFSTEYECYITENNVDTSKIVEIHEEGAKLTVNLDEKGEILSMTRATDKVQQFFVLIGVFFAVIAGIDIWLFYSIWLILFITKHIYIAFSKFFKKK